MNSAPAVPGEAPILAELASVGYPFRSLSDLRESGLRYREAVPALVTWLSRASDRKVKKKVDDRRAWVRRAARRAVNRLS